MANTTIKTDFVRTTDGHKVYYDHYQNGHGNAVLIAHGFFNSRSSALIKELGLALSTDYDVFLMDFRGHGQSQGLFYWTAKEYLDLQAVLGYARQQYARIGVIGFSLGAASGIIAASKTDGMKSLVCVSAPTELKKIEFHFWKLDIENDIVYNLTSQGRAGKGVRPGPFWLKKDTPIQSLDKINIPIMYIHGNADWIIKPWHSEALFARTRSLKRIRIIDKGLHAEYLIRKNKEETVSAIQEWFKETLQN